MEGKTLLPDWDRCYPGCEPVGHLLREAFPDRWVRFHSLPDSKRYPDTEDEFAELLARHNIIMGELAGRVAPVVLVIGRYSESSDPHANGEFRPAFAPDATVWRTVVSPDDPLYMHLFACEVVWETYRFDQLVRAVAVEEVANVLIVASDCQWVLHPYDGGMDVIARSTEERNRLRSQHLAWFSGRSDGL